MSLEAAISYRTIYGYVGAPDGPLAYLKIQKWWQGALYATQSILGDAVAVGSYRFHDHTSVLKCFVFHPGLSLLGCLEPQLQACGTTGRPAHREHQ